MKTSLVQNALVVKKSPIHGYGVFSEKEIQPKEIIEECIVFVNPQFNEILNNYAFYHEKLDGAIPLGFGCLYNHSDVPNAQYYFNEEKNLLIFEALMKISQGEEIFINYGKDWFSSREMVVKTIPAWKKAWRYFLGMPLRAIIVVAIISGLRVLYSFKF